MSPAEPDISVIICSHNSREHHLGQTLAALRAQSRPLEGWELVVVDNASFEPLAGRLDLLWHPCGRVVREERLGLTHARLRGIAESRAPILVFVDDDNVLEPDYLSLVVKIAHSQSGLGAWGGNIRLRFEVPPPEWTRDHWSRLAMRTVFEEKMSADPFDWESMPYGAGLCVRRQVAIHYQREIDRMPWRGGMDRRGRDLMSAGDLDLACTACDMNLKKGVFPCLRLDHLIPPERWAEPYLLRLTTAAEFSNHLLRWCRDPASPEPRLSARRFIRHIKECVRLRGRERRFYLARIRGERAAVSFHRSLAGDAAQASSSFVRDQRFLGENAAGKTAST